MTWKVVVRRLAPVATSHTVTRHTDDGVLCHRRPRPGFKTLKANRTTFAHTQCQSPKVMPTRPVDPSIYYTAQDRNCYSYIYNSDTSTDNLTSILDLAKGKKRSTARLFHKHRDRRSSTPKAVKYVTPHMPWCLLHNSCDEWQVPVSQDDALLESTSAPAPYEFLSNLPRDPDARVILSLPVVLPIIAQLEVVLSASAYTSKCNPPVYRGYPLHAA
jgi:hypothetical protein